MAALTYGDDWYHLMNKMAESADLPPSDHGEISESDGMGTHSTQSDVNWIQEMRLIDPNPHEGMSDHLTQASVAQETQEARYVQSAQMPIQVPHTRYPVPPYSPAYDSRPGSLNSVVINTPINTMKASSVGRCVTPSNEDRQRKRLRDWQSRLTGLEGQDLHPEHFHFDRGISEFDHPRASQMNQMGSLYATARYKMQGNEGRQHKLARNCEFPAVNQGQGIYNEVIHYPGYSTADFWTHSMNREIQPNSPRLTVDSYISIQATEGQQNHLTKLLQNKPRENPTEMVQILSGDDLKNHIMEILIRPHFPQAHPENLDDIKPPTRPLNLPSQIKTKLHCRGQIEPYKPFYKDRMMKLYQNLEASTNSPVVNKIGDWSFILFEIKQVNTHPSDLMALMIPSTEKGNWYTNPRLYSNVISIQEWLTKVHSVLWKEFKGDISPQADHQKMMLWFFQEVFNPQYGIPILSAVYIQDLINAQIGPVQIWIMRLLKGEQSLQTTSVAISAIWFKKTSSEQWEKYFQDDSYFWNCIYGLFSTHVEPVEQQVQLSKFHQALGKFIHIPHDRSGIWDLSIGDFKIKSKPPSIQLIGKPPTSETKAKATLKIMKTQAEIHLHARQASVIHATNKDLGIAITKQSQEVDGYFYIRLMNKRSELLRTSLDQKRSLSSFVDHLEFYSSCIISSLDLPLNSQDTYQTNFLDWVHLKLFGDGTDLILPIQGRVRQSFFNQPTVPTFDKVQIFILENNVRQANNKNHHAAPMLFGYWLKNKHAEIWNAKFKTDEEFSEFLYTIKGPYF
ncbi:hypothetical protein MJO28_012660 [Puccinia striiformis f. sp. tritici]|uniref:Uncharacterized protein n=1 Tax=Puccinia striiformis f. sp. tritici TaxID=168172 RepID=A0ACC0E3J0_9BASI|nr:hypothetical protein MJO28_012660 [Puccinia striiformis f. sp. tritici]KAI7945384.1 hypothetical protein MJO29_011772 [Puccinia striiformis f. sp. tritici]